MSWLRITRPDPLRDPDEERVAGAVAERVVHEFEVVDVEVEDADRRAVPTRCRDRALELLA